VGGGGDSGLTKVVTKTKGGGTCQAEFFSVEKKTIKGEHKDGSGTSKKKKSWAKGLGAKQQSGGQPCVQAGRAA